MHDVDLRTGRAEALADLRNLLGGADVGIGLASLPR